MVYWYWLGDRVSGTNVQDIAFPQMHYDEHDDGDENWDIEVTGYFTIFYEGSLGSKEGDKN